MILVVGASGRVGSALVRELVAREAPVRALIRSAARGAELGAGVEPFVGDLTDERSVAAALEDVDRLFLMSPDDPRLTAAQAGLLEQATAAGVRHVVYLSSVGAGDTEAMLCRQHRQREEQVEASGMAWTHLRPHLFTQNLLMAAPTIADQGSIFLPTGSAAVAMVDVRDVAEAAAAVLTGEGHEGRIHELTGPEAITLQQAAEAVGAVLGRPVVHVDIPPAVFLEVLLGVGAPEPAARAVVDLYVRVFAAGRCAATTEAVQALTGRAPRSVADFARDHVGAFRPRA